MPKALPRSRRLALAALLVSLVASGGLAAIAYASIPDGTGTIHGCYKTNGGDLRVIDDSTSSCRSSETALDWSQTGPQGPQGPQGPPGPEGSGHAFVSDEGVVTIHGPTEVVGLSGLPAGSYLVWSPIEVVGDDNDGTDNTCLWVINGSRLMVPDGDTFMYDGKDNGFGRADMFGVVTLATDDSSIVARCDANTDGAQEFGRMTALEVGSVN